jgi:hypothetical protein
MADQHAALPRRYRKNPRIFQTFERNFLGALEIDSAVAPDHTGDNRRLQIGIRKQSENHARSANMRDRARSIFF